MASPTGELVSDLTAPRSTSRSRSTPPPTVQRIVTDPAEGFRYHSFKELGVL